MFLQLQIYFSDQPSLHQAVSTSHYTMDCRRPGFPVPHHLPEFAQVHDHWITDAIQPSHPLSLSSSIYLDTYYSFTYMI